MVMGSFYEESFKYLPIPQKVNKRNGKNVAPLCITFISVNACSFESYNIPFV